MGRRRSAAPDRHKKKRQVYHKDIYVIRLYLRKRDHVWTIDFVHDKLSDGPSFKMPAVLDQYTREMFYMTARPRLNASTGGSECRVVTQHSNGRGRNEYLAQAINQIRPHRSLNMSPLAPETLLGNSKTSGTETGG